MKKLKNAENLKKKGDEKLFGTFKRTADGKNYDIRGKSEVHDSSLITPPGLSYVAGAWWYPLNSAIPCFTCNSFSIPRC